MCHFYLGEISYPDFCFFNIAYIYGDKTVCRRITDENLAKDCIEEINIALGNA